MSKSERLGRLKAALEACGQDCVPPPFDPGRPVVKLHESTYGIEEVWEAVQVLLSTNVTMGERVRRFEDEFAKTLGYRHAAMCNSGSSANLLAVAALANPAVSNHLKPGDEVIVPALCWSTTVWPLIQHHLVPVVVDMDHRTLNIDPNEIERAIGPKTRAAMVVPIYGNPCDMTSITEICKRRSLTLIEDSCESLGARYKDRPVGTFGRVATFSFYFSHHITTMEGGMVVTGDPEVSEMVRILRAHGWVRETAEPKRYWEQYPNIHPKFLFVNIGYNLRPTEVQGAFGTEQLKKLGSFIEIRRDNARFFRQALSEYSSFFEFQEETPGGSSSWFGFPMLVKEGAPFTNRDLMQFCEARGVEMRPLNAGNIANQPAIKLYPHRVVGDLRHANHAMKDGFTFGNHQHVDDRARKYIVQVVHDFFASRKLA